MTSNLITILVALAMVLHVAMAACPVPPVQCKGGNGGCQVNNYRGLFEDEKPCKAWKAVFPRTETELIDAVAKGVKSDMKMKVATSGSHSLPRVACPGGNHGLIISTSKYNSRIHIDHQNLTVTVDSGVELRELLDRLAVHDLALPHTPDWDHLSVGGLLGTGAHGTGLWGLGSSLHDRVVALSIVVPASPKEGYAKLRSLGPSDPDLNAARFSLGVLGVVSQVTLLVEKMFKRSVSVELKDDTKFEDTLLEFAHAHEFGEAHWYPSFNKVLYSVQDRVPVTVAGNGSFANPFYLPFTVQDAQSTRNAEEQFYVSGNMTAMCEMVQASTVQGVESGDGFLNDGKSFTGYPVVGYNHMMQASSGCQGNKTNDPSCPWRAKDLKPDDLVCIWDVQAKGVFFFHIAIGIPLSRLPEAIKDIKKIKDIEGSSPFCGLDFYLGIEIRYFKKSKSYLGHREDTALVEFISFRFREKGRPRVNEHVVEEMEQMLLQKYEGIPHFGKNRVYTFDGAAQKTVSLEKFLEVKERFDKHGLFSSEWSDRVLGLGNQPVMMLKKGCAIDGYCVCKEDKHCAPKEGYRCVAGSVWKEARVCKKV